MSVPETGRLMVSRMPGISLIFTSRAVSSMRNGPFLPGAPLCESSTRPPNASSEIVEVGDDEKSAPRSEVDTLAFSIEKRVGFPDVGRVLTRMFEKLTPTPQVGPADSISTSKPCAAATLMATSLARS